MPIHAVTHARTSLRSLPDGGTVLASHRRLASAGDRLAWAGANSDFVAGRVARIERADERPLWATDTFVRQLGVFTERDRRKIVAAAHAVSTSPYHPHPALAARKLMREPLGALTTSGRCREFLTWRVDPERERVVLLTIERPAELRVPSARAF